VSAVTTKDFEEISAGWRPDPATVTGRIELAPLERLAALLNVPAPGPGGALPPLWHEVQLRDAPAPADLGEDGHPRSGALLPPLADRRRMFGGAVVEHQAPLRVDDVATRTSKVADVRVRPGRSGTLLLVTEEHVWSVGGEERLRERRDIVYRRAADIVAPTVVLVDSEPDSEALVADERYLFAYSALTYNLHRIHYDATYVREVEGYPGLVVHGPLLALWCAEHARRRLGREPASLAYRLTSTAYVGHPVAVISNAAVDGALTVEARSQGRTCVRMTVTP
jgi:3-methylfumaryl-CoA hydratase